MFARYSDLPTPMLTRRTFTLASLAWGATGRALGSDVLGSGLGLASTQTRLVKDAEREGALRIYAATGLLTDQDLMALFQRLYPRIAVHYYRASSSELHSRFLREAAAGGPTADILISSAMDLQFKLVNDGFAQVYESPEKPQLPEWAVWNDEAYTISVDPLAFAYNHDLMPPGDVPRSHHELTDLLVRKPHEYRGKVTTYDPRRSGTGYLYYTQDLMLSRDTLDLVQAMGRAQTRLYVAGRSLREKLASGDHLLSYNVVNAHTAARRHANISLVFPNDYTLVMSRVAIISKAARNPAAGRLFLDFLLSEPAQHLIALQFSQPIRTGVATVGPTPPQEVVRRIHFGPSLLANLDEFRRRQVLHEFRRAFES